MTVLTTRPVGIRKRKSSGATATRASVAARLRELFVFPGTSLGEFQLELAQLGLLGAWFSPEGYRRALMEHIGVETEVVEVSGEYEVIVGGRVVGVGRQMYREGILAEVAYDSTSGAAVIFIRESLRYLPWPAYDLSLFHELSHIAASHPVGRMLVKNEEGTDNITGEDESAAYEREARKRANWLLLAANYPQTFENEGMDQWAG